MYTEGNIMPSQGEFKIEIEYDLRNLMSNKQKTRMKKMDDEFKDDTFELYSNYIDELDENKKEKLFDDLLLYEIYRRSDRDKINKYLDDLIEQNRTLQEETRPPPEEETPDYDFIPYFNGMAQVLGDLDFGTLSIGDNEDRSLIAIYHNNYQKYNYLNETNKIVKTMASLYLKYELNIDNIKKRDVILQNLLYSFVLSIDYLRASIIFNIPSKSLIHQLFFLYLIKLLNTIKNRIKLPDNYLDKPMKRNKTSDQEIFKLLEEERKIYKFDESFNQKIFDQVRNVIQKKFVIDYDSYYSFKNKIMIKDHANIRDILGIHLELYLLMVKNFLEKEGLIWFIYSNYSQQKRGVSEKEIDIYPGNISNLLRSTYDQLYQAYSYLKKKQSRLELSDVFVDILWFVASR